MICVRVKHCNSLVVFNKRTIPLAQCLLVVLVVKIVNSGRILTQIIARFFRNTHSVDFIVYDRALKSLVW